MCMYVMCECLCMYAVCESERYGYVMCEGEGCMCM